MPLVVSGFGDYCRGYCCCAVRGGRGGEGVRLVQRFAAAVAFLVQAALAALHHVNKVGQRLFLVHRDIPEVTTHRLQEEKEEARG